MRRASLSLACVMLVGCGETPAPRAPVDAAPNAAPNAAFAPIASPAAVVAPLASPGDPIDPPPERRALRNDDVYLAFLDRVAKAEPRADDPKHLTWLRVVLAAAFEAREYQRMERYARVLLELNPDDPAARGELSLALGKQGKYEAALAEADVAATRPNAHLWHIQAIRASWLYHLGRHHEGETLFAAIAAPAEGSDEWPMYQGCRACFSASSHNLPALKDSIRILAALGGHEVEFVQRDVIFDQYRHLDWFRELAGDTLAPTL